MLKTLIFWWNILPPSSEQSSHPQRESDKIWRQAERKDSARRPTRDDGTKSGRTETAGKSFPLCALDCAILYFCGALFTNLKMEAVDSSEMLNFYHNPRDPSQSILCHRNGLWNF